MRRIFLPVGLLSFQVVAVGALALDVVGPSSESTPQRPSLKKETSAAGADNERFLPRIGVRKGTPWATFIVKEKNAPFFVKGFNYVRLRRTHATFEAATRTTAAHYDPKQADAMFQTLARHGYNTVRVFICGRHPEDPGIAGDYHQTRGLYGLYLENFLDFLNRARQNGVYVLPTFGDGELPRNDYYRSKLRDLPRGTGAIYFTREGIDAKKEYVAEFLRFIKDRDRRLLTTLLGVECQNELHVRSDQWPYDLCEGRITAPNGKTYDLSDAGQRRALMEEGLRHYHAELVRTVKAIDPELLVAEGLFSMRAVGKSLPTHAGIWPGSSADPRFPPTLVSLGQGDLDFLDVHFYRTRPQETVAEAFRRDMDSSLLSAPEMQQIRRNKPIIVGEFGAFRHVDRDFQQARANLLAIRDLIVQRHFNGMLYWTYDTFEQKALYPAMEDGGAFLSELAPRGP